MIKFDKLVGYEVIDSNDTTTTVKLEVNDTHKNLYDYVHGGVYFTLCDVSAGYQLNQGDDRWVTLNADINYLKAAKEGPLYAVSSVINIGSKVAVMECMVKDDADTIFAKATVTMYKVAVSS